MVVFVPSGIFVGEILASEPSGGRAAATPANATSPVAVVDFGSKSHASIVRK